MPCLGSSQYTQGYFCSHSFASELVEVKASLVDIVVTTSSSSSESLLDLMLSLSGKKFLRSISILCRFVFLWVLFSCRMLLAEAFVLYIQNCE